MAPKVSIIIATFNSADYIAECLKSIFSQSYNAYEVIIIDDGSTDDTKSVVEKECCNRSDVVYIFQDNTGPGVARNKGIDVSSGDYLIFMDPDDKYPNCYSIERLVEAAVENGARICGGEIIDYENGIDTLRYRAGLGDSLKTKNAFISTKDYYYMYGHTRYLFDAELIKVNNIRFLDVRRFEDQVFTMQALAIAGELYELEYPVYWHRKQVRLDYSYEVWVDILKGYVETLKILVLYDMELMFIKNAPDLIISFVGKCKSKGLLKNDIVKDLADEIESLFTSTSWINMSLNDYFRLSDNIGTLLMNVPEDKKIVLYGAGINAQKFLSIYWEPLKEKIIGIAVTKVDNGGFDQIYGLTINAIEYYEPLKNDVIILIVTSRRYKKNIEETLLEKGFSLFYWIDVRLIC